MSLIFCQQLIWKIWESKVETEIYIYVYPFSWSNPKKSALSIPFFKSSNLQDHPKILTWSKNHQWISVPREITSCHIIPSPPGVPHSWLLRWKSPDQLEDSSLAFLEKPTLFLSQKKNRKMFQKKNNNISNSNPNFPIPFWCHLLSCPPNLLL